MDFSGLDEAFGDDPPLVTSTGNSIGKKRKITGEILEGGKRSGERKIDLCELVVELTAQGGPRSSFFSSLLLSLSSTSTDIY